MFNTAHCVSILPQAAGVQLGRDYPRPIVPDVKAARAEVLAAVLQMRRGAQVSTRIVGRRTALFSPFRIPYRVPHGVTPRS